MLTVVNVTKLDGQLGQLPIDALSKYLAVLGPATSGPLNTPQAMSRPKDIITTFGSGAMVEEACFFAQRYGRTVIPIRTDFTTAGSAGTLVATFTGTSVPTFDGTANSNDDYDLLWVAVAGGTIGVAGITFQWSLDGGRTMSAVTALGTATTFTIPGTGTPGVKINFGAGTVIAADKITSAPTQPIPNAAQLATALTALQNSSLPWEFANMAFPIDAALFDQLETSFAAIQATGRHRVWQGGFRRPNVAESEATYKTAFDAIFSVKSTTIGTVWAGDAKTASAVTGRNYRRRTSVACGARAASVSEEVNIAEIDQGAIPGVTIVDANGNPENHDELVNPGLDDSRAAVLRSWPGRAGAFVNRPLILSPSGSDFTIMPYARIFNLYLETIIPYLQRRLNKPIRVKASNGRILEADALEIESTALRLLQSVLTTKPKASGVQFSCRRDDNLLSTRILTCDGGIIPLVYPEKINFSLGMVNPALRLIQV